MYLTLKIHRMVSSIQYVCSYGDNNIDIKYVLTKDKTSLHTIFLKTVLLFHF